MNSFIYIIDMDKQEEMKKAPERQLSLSVEEKEQGAEKEEIEYDEGCCRRYFINPCNGFLQYLHRYLQCDFIARQQELVEQDRVNRYMQSYDESYEERKKYFVYSFDQVLREREKAEYRRFRFGWDDFKRFICCEKHQTVRQLDQEHVEHSSQGMVKDNRQLPSMLQEEEDRKIAFEVSQKMNEEPLYFEQMTKTNLKTESKNGQQIENKETMSNDKEDFVKVLQDNRRVKVLKQNKIKLRKKRKNKKKEANVETIQDIEEQQSQEYQFEEDQSQSSSQQQQEQQSEGTSSFIESQRQYEDSICQRTQELFYQQGNAKEFRSEKNLKVKKSKVIDVKHRKPGDVQIQQIMLDEKKHIQHRKRKVRERVKIEQDQAQTVQLKIKNRKVRNRRVIQFTTEAQEILEIQHIEL